MIPWDLLRSHIDGVSLRMVCLRDERKKYLATDPLPLAGVFYGMLGPPALPESAWSLTVPQVVTGAMSPSRKQGTFGKYWSKDWQYGMDKIGTEQLL